MGQVPPRAVEVETIPHDEHVGNVEPHEIGLGGHLGPTGLPHEHERSHARSPSTAEFRDDRLERSAGVEDVVHEEHLAARQVGQRIEPQLQPARRRGRAAVAARRDHGQLDRAFEPPDEIGHEHDAAREHPHHDERPAVIFAANRGGEPVDPGGEFGGGEQDMHGDGV